MTRPPLRPVALCYQACCGSERGLLPAHWSARKRLPKVLVTRGEKQSPLVRTPHNGPGKAQGSSDWFCACLGQPCGLEPRQPAWRRWGKSARTRHLLAIGWPGAATPRRGSLLREGDPWWPRPRLWSPASLPGVKDEGLLRDQPGCQPCLASPRSSSKVDGCTRCVNPLRARRKAALSAPFTLVHQA